MQENSVFAYICTKPVGLHRNCSAAFDEATRLRVPEETTRDRERGRRDAHPMCEMQDRKMLYMNFAVRRLELSRSAWA
jgi:hypothetical protein